MSLWSYSIHWRWKLEVCSPKKETWVAQNRKNVSRVRLCRCLSGLSLIKPCLIKGTCGTCYGKALHLQVKQEFSCKCSWKTTCWCFQMVSNVFIFDFNAFWRTGWWFAMAFMLQPGGCSKHVKTNSPFFKGRCSHTQMVGLSKSLPWFSILEYPRCILWYLQPVCCIILTHRKPIIFTKDDRQNNVTSDRLTIN